MSTDARKRFELLDECREMVVTRLCAVIGDALKNIGEELGDLALKSVRREEQRALMDAATLVRQNHSEIESRFRKAFIDTFERRLFMNQDSKPDQPGARDDDEETELTLVDDSVISDKLSVDRLVHRARGKLDPDEVLGIRARLAALLEREWFDETLHPAAPEAVFEALKKALGELAPAQEVQTALLDAFEPHVSSQLNQVYSSVNDRLKANRVLPKIRPQVAVNRSTPRRPPAEAAAPNGAAQAGQPGPAGQGGPAGAMQGGDAMPGLLADGGHDFGAMMHQLAQGVPAARESVARMLTDPLSFGVADLPLPSAQPRLIESISSLQASSMQNRMAAPQMFAEISDRARDSGSPLDQLTVEIVSLVFDYIYSDKRLAAVIKQQLLRLQVVAVKAALLDRSFFARRQHPMRRLIDRISELATDPDSNVAADAPLVKELEGLVEWLLGNFDRDLSTFDEALDRLEQMAGAEAERRAERLSQVTREAERQEALANGTQTARGLLTDRVESDTPLFVREFLDQWWAPAIALAGLAGEGAPIRAADALQVAEALIWSVTPKLPEEISRLAALLPKLIGGLSRGVKLATMPDAPREAFFNSLLRTHASVIEAAKLSAKVPASRAVSRLRMRSDGSIKYTPPRSDAEVQRAASTAAPTAAPTAAAAAGGAGQGAAASFARRAPSGAAEAAAQATGTGPSARLAAQAQGAVAPAVPLRGIPSRLARGARIEIDEAGQLLVFKLAWVSPTQKLYVLSRFPDEARSMDAASFGQLFSSGKARVIEQHSAMDKAIDSIAVDRAAAAVPVQDRPLDAVV